MDRWKAEQGRGREKRKIRRKKMQMCEKVGKSRNTVFFPMIWGSGGSKSRLAKAAGAEPAGQMRDENLHAVVARSTFPSQNVQNTRGSDNFWKLRCRKSARRCGAKHISKSKCTKHHGFGPLLEVEMSKKCTPLWRKAHFEVKMYKALGVRTAFGGSDVASLRFTTLHYTPLHSTTLHYIKQHYNILQLQLHNYTPLHSTTLHYTKLHYATLHYTTLHYTSLHCTTLHYLPVHFTTLHYTTLHYTTSTTTTTQLHSTTIHSTTPNYATLHYTTLRYMTLHYTPLQIQLRLRNYTPLHYTTLHYTTLHYTTFHYTPLPYTPLHYPTLHWMTLHHR